MIPIPRGKIRNILVTQPGGVQPYVGQWWPPGHIIGYEHTFTNTLADFLVDLKKRKQSFAPDFRDGWANQEVLDAALKSADSGDWTKVKQVEGATKKLKKRRGAAASSIGA